MFERLLDRFRGFGPLRQAAWEHLHQSRHEQAHQLIRRGLRHFPSLSAFKILKVRHQLLRGETQNSDLLLQEQEQIEPVDEYDVYELAENYRLLERYDKARNWYQKIVNCGNSEVRSLAHRGMAVVEQRNQNFDLALEHCVESFMHGKRNIHPWMVELGVSSSKAAVSRSLDKLTNQIPNAENDFFPTTYAALLSAQREDWDQAISLAGQATRIRYRSHPAAAQWNENAPPLSPRFLIIGAMKCGTTSLFEQFCFHPDFLPPLRKELHFQFQDWPIEFYLAQFPKIRTTNNTITGEASPSYVAQADVESIKRNFPEIKIVFLRRNPVDRAISHLFHNRRIFISESSQQSLREGQQAILDLHRTNHVDAEKPLYERFSDSKKLNRHLLLGCYELFLPKWRSSFGPSQLLEVEFEDYVNRTQETLDRVYDFVGQKRHPLQPTEKKYSNAYRTDSTDWDRCRIELNEFYQTADGLLKTK